VYATPGDVQRIAEFTGRDNFTEFRAPANELYSDQDDDPLWRDRVFRKDHTRRVLKREENGDCTFLSETGCVLPYETRPLVCRLYPYEYTEEGIADDLADGCPLELLAPGQGLIEALDMNLEKARLWHRMLYDEIHLEPEG
jgi:Fe-S-cluster containining protein